jgi:hypothetical protein
MLLTSRLLSRGFHLALASLTTLSLISLAPTLVQAKAGDVVRTGTCSALGKWKLKLSPENGQIEVNAEIDNVRPGTSYRVQLFQNGVLFYNVVQAVSPLGKIDIARIRPNAAGADTVRLLAVSATAPINTCAGSATATF